MTEHEEALRLAAVAMRAMRLLHDLDDVVRAISVAARLVSDLITCVSELFP
jgi:hypothetical protein